MGRRRRDGGGGGEKGRGRSAQRAAGLRGMLGLQGACQWPFFVLPMAAHSSCNMAARLGLAHIWSFIRMPPPTRITRPPPTPSDAISLVRLKLSASEAASEAAVAGPASSAATISASTCLPLLLLLLLLQGTAGKRAGGWQLQSA